jgi:hypothetical protein
VTEQPKKDVMELVEEIKSFIGERVDNTPELVDAIVTLRWDEETRKTTPGILVHHSNDGRDGPDIVLQLTEALHSSGLKLIEHEYRSLLNLTRNALKSSQAADAETEQEEPPAPPTNDTK